MTVKVAVNGFGTIGKRTADAVTWQKDMEIIGVSKTRPTYEAFIAAERKFPLYVLKGKEDGFGKAGIEVAGTIEEMVREADIVVDCAPGKKGVDNLQMYKDAKVKAIFQGGEKHETAGTSFNAMVNYDEAKGKQFVRVVSCNTTGLLRTLFPLDRDIGIDHCNAVMVRRAVDPRDSKKGPVNAIKPVLKLPSHHGPDVMTVMKDLRISTMAVAVPTTLMHLHCNIVELKRPAEPSEVLGIWEGTRRVKLIEGARGFESTAEIMEYAKDLCRARGDINEIVVWRDGMNVVDRTLYYYQAIHQESDVIPEIVDCIRAMCGVEGDGGKSMAMTDDALGLTK